MRSLGGAISRVQCSRNRGTAAELWGTLCPFSAKAIQYIDGEKLCGYCVISFDVLRRRPTVNDGTSRTTSYEYEEQRKITHLEEIRHSAFLAFRIQILLEQGRLNGL